MDTLKFDRFARRMAAGHSRRSVLRRAAGSALAAPLSLAGLHAADGQGRNKDKNKDRKKDKGGPGNSGCRGEGHPCEGNQVCCDGLACEPTGPGNAWRCGRGAASLAPQQTQTNQNVVNQTANQTVVQTNNQVCAGDCDQTNQQIVDTSVQQTVLAGSPGLFGVLPTYRVDLQCTYDAPAYRTICNGIGVGPEGAPLVHDIELPRDGFCATVIDRSSRPERRETIRRTVPMTTNTSGNASAGTGGVANASADGGSVTIGDVRGGNDIAIDASGGTANADASGGDNNVAIVGGGQRTEEIIEQIVEPSTLTLTLEGNVVPGKTTTYWLQTDAGRRPASGPTLLQVADETVDTGAIIVEAWSCGIAAAQQGFDWFGQCTQPASMGLELFSTTGDGAAVASATTDAQGRARFANLSPGTYEVRPTGPIWCYAESDRVDANGQVVVEAQRESHVWSFVCGAGS